MRHSFFNALSSGPNFYFCFFVEPTGSFAYSFQNKKVINEKLESERENYFYGNEQKLKKKIAELSLEMNKPYKRKGFYNK